MPLRFQRRIRILPGLHINLSRSGVGLSVGTRGAHIGIDSRGRRYTSVGLPGTGVSWREYQHKPAGRCDLCAPGHAHIHPGIAILVLIIAAVILILLMAR